MTKYKNNVRMFATSCGDTGRPALFFYCSEEVQKEFDGKRVDIQFAHEKLKRKVKR